MTRVLLFIVAVFAFYAFAVEELRIVNPSSLASLYPSGVPNKPALFGIPPYGVSITGRIIYATPGDRDGCSTLNTSVVENWPDVSESFIVMVDRGECTFVSKVQHAQDTGAKAVIVVDNVEETTLPYMADDGNGGSLTTPSLLVSLDDGQNIKDALFDGSVLATMRWGVPHPDNIVEWSMWTSSYDENSNEFKTNFEEVSNALGKDATYTARYFFLKGEDYGCTGLSGQACGSQCTNSGKYCAVDPEHDLSTGIDGADVVRENLRQMCVFRYANDTDNVDLWWQYVNQFQSDCAMDTSTFTISCSETVLASLEIPSATISTCISSSGGYATDGGDNALIDAEITLRRDTGVYLLPSVLVNNVIYRGSLTCNAPIDVSDCGVLSAICAGYASGSEPEACSSTNGCGLGQVRDDCGECGGTGSYDFCGVCLPADHPDRTSDGDDCTDVYTQSSGSMSATKVVLIVFVIISVVSLAFFYLHRRSQANMRRELADIMSQYVPLDSSGDATNVPMIPSALDSAY